VRGAASGIGSIATQLAHEVGAYVTGTGRTTDRQSALDFGPKEFVGLENAALGDPRRSRSGFSMSSAAPSGSGPQA
jgi:NADPH:quinone reductase-like Zn-dependent oxidoreductase